MNSLISNIPSSIFSKDDCRTYISNMKDYLNNEKNRYNNFIDGFKSFYDPIESIDSGLASMLQTQFDFVENNEDYNIYVTMLQLNYNEELEENIYDKLIELGLSEEDAMKIALLMSPEAQEKLKELSALDEDELNKSLKEIDEKATKSPVELVLLDLFALNKVDTYASTGKDILEGFTNGGMAGLIERMYLGKQLSGYNNDIKSIT